MSSYISRDSPDQETEKKLYKQFKASIRGRTTEHGIPVPNWDGMSTQLSNKRYKDKFNSLLPHERAFFFELVDLLIERVDSEIGPNNFHGTLPGRWNIIVWLAALLQLAKTDQPIEGQSCKITNLEGSRARGQVQITHKG